MNSQQKKFGILHRFLHDFLCFSKYLLVFALLTTFCFHPLSHAAEGNPPEGSEAWKVISEYFGEENYLPELGCWAVVYQYKKEGLVMHRASPQLEAEAAKKGESELWLIKCMYVRKIEDIKNSESNHKLYIWLDERGMAEEKINFTRGYHIYHPMLFVKNNSIWTLSADFPFECTHTGCSIYNLHLKKISAKNDYAWIYESEINLREFSVAKYHILLNIDKKFYDIGCNNTIKFTSEIRPYSLYKMNFIKDDNAEIYPIKFTHYISTEPMVFFKEKNFAGYKKLSFISYFDEKGKDFTVTAPVYKGNSITFFFSKEKKCYDFLVEQLYFL